MSGLPKGWVSSPLNDVSNVVRGITFPASAKELSHTSDNVCCLRTSNIQREVEWSNIYFVDRSYVKRDEQFVQSGDVLMSMANSYELVGKVAIAKAVSYPTAFGAFLSAIRPTTAIDGKYLFHLLRTSKVQGELRQGSNQTTNIANISVGTLASIEIPLAPLPEQKRIADKLDTVLGRVDACRDRLDRIPSLLKRFRQSILAAATSGRLTEDWRGINSNRDGVDKKSAVQFVQVDEPYSHIVKAPLSWRKSTIGDEVEIIGGSQPPKSTFIDRDAPGYIRLIQIRDYKSDKHLTYIPRELAKRFCNKREVMIGRYGPPIFQILRGLEGAYNVALMKAQPISDELDLDYLFYFLKGDVLLKYVEAGSDRTAGQDGVRKELLHCYPMFVPSIEEQKEIVRRVETLFAFADRLEARYATARKQVEQLTPALLAKAFRGELVSQDPKDEPAVELLKRLAAVRLQKSEATPKAKRSKKVSEL